MTQAELEHELKIKYAQHKKKLSDPFELLDLIAGADDLHGNEKEKAIQLAEEIYFGIGEEYEPNR